METVNKPNHYNKGEIDLYESWYLTRPFNEFRAIMESIAERYMKRDKFNRIEDLDKAIYTLTRLREYELREMEKNSNTLKVGDVVNLKGKNSGVLLEGVLIVAIMSEKFSILKNGREALFDFDSWEITKCEK